MQFTERVLMITIGGACIVAVTGLLMGFSPSEILIPLASFGAGTFFPSLVSKEGVNA